MGLLFQKFFAPINPFTGPPAIELALDPSPNDNYLRLLERRGQHDQGVSVFEKNTNLMKKRELLRYLRLVLIKTHQCVHHNLHNQHMSFHLTWVPFFIANSSGQQLDEPPHVFLACIRAVFCLCFWLPLYMF